MKLSGNAQSAKAKDSAVRLRITNRRRGGMRAATAQPPRVLPRMREPIGPQEVAIRESRHSPRIRACDRWTVNAFSFPAVCR